MIEESIDQPSPPLRVYDVAIGLLGACDIPPSQAVELAVMIVDLFRELERLREEAD